MDVVLSLTWASAYQSVQGLVRHFAPSWRESGLELVELNLSAPDWSGQLRALLAARRIRFVFSTSGIGANVAMDGVNLWEKLNLPVYSLLLDHPVYLAANHRTQSKTTVLGYMFRDHAHFQTAAVGAENIVTTIDYGIPDLPIAPAAAGRPRIIFAKTGNSAAALAESWRTAPKLEAILHDALAELALTRTGNAHVAAFAPLLTRIAAAHDIFLQPFSLLTRFLIAQLDDYLRRQKSTLLAEALLPFEVDIFGTAWDHIDTAGARAKFHGPVDYAALEAQFPGATASVTMNPNIDFTAHDRFFTALGAGIMPLSDRNHYTATTFPELSPYGFDFTPGSIAAALELALANPAQTRDTALATRTRARPAHGVEQAATSIMQAMQTAALVQSGSRPVQNFFVP